MNLNKELYSKSSISIVYHKSKSLTDYVRSIIREFFIESDDFYIKMSNDDFRGLIAKAQKKLNDENITNEIITNIYNDLINYLNTDQFLIQSNLYLRVSRPQNNTNDSIGWHRENFYAPNADNYINIWTPIDGVNEFNTIKFIPESQKIKNENIKTINIDDKITKKYSLGHKIGLMYSPKKIISGINFNQQKPMIVPYYSSSIFSGNLVHGAAHNDSKTTRFSLDFRIIDESFYNKELNKKHHYASGKEYFIKFIK